MSGKPSTSVPASIVDLSVITPLIVAVIYTIGWHYTAAFYQNFYLDLKYVDTSLERNLINGMQVIRKDMETLFLFIMGGCVLLPYLRRLPLSPDSHLSRSLFQSARWILTIGLLLGIYYGGMYLGEKRAEDSFRQHRRDGFRDFPAVSVSLQKATTSSVCYHRLLDSGNQIFLFETTRRGGRFRLRLPVVMLPHNRIEKIEAFPNLTLCNNRIAANKRTLK